ncbi:MAG: hypothetical protein ACKOFB_00040 [bacterium]
MGKIFLFLIALLLLIVFAGLALLGFARRMLLSIIPQKKSKPVKDNSIIYDDGNITVHSTETHGRSKRRS